MTFIELIELSYVYVFLPSSVVLYHLTPRHLRPSFLALVSCAFLLLRSLQLMVWSLAATLALYLCAMQAYRGRYSLVRKRAAAIAGIVLAAAAFFGYVFFVEDSGVSLVILAAILLSGLSCTFDLSKGESVKLHSFDRFAAFCLFFGKLLYGPLVSADDFILQMLRAKSSARQMGLGVVLLFTGLAQLIVLEKSLSALAVHLDGAPPGVQCLLIVIVLILITALRWYFKLSGYSLMAQGTGMLFGFELPRSHAYPFGAGSLTSYFNRFLITHNAYARTYIAPLLGGGSQVGSGNLLAVSACAVFAGLWLGVPGGILWGILFGFIIRLEHLPRPRERRSSPGVIKRVIVFIAGSAGFILLIPNGEIGYFESLAELFGAVADMPVYSDLGLYAMIEFLPFVLASLLLATRLAQGISTLLKLRTPRIYNVASLCWALGMMVLCLSAMMDMGGVMS